MYVVQYSTGKIFVFLGWTLKTAGSIDTTVSTGLANIGIIYGFER